MNNDRSAPSAGRLATLIAVPVALLAGFLVFEALKPSPPPKPTPRVVPSGPVAVAPAALSPADASACKALIAAMPAQVRDVPRREVTGAPDQAAAYGQAIVKCGGPQPSFAPTDFVYPISGVCWAPDTDGTRWSTVDRTIPVVIELGSGEAGEGSGQWAAAFSELVGKTIPASPARPSGCG